MAEEMKQPVSLHFLQKHLLVNFDIYTDTGITGVTLSNAVPLLPFVQAAVRCSGFNRRRAVGTDAVQRIIFGHAQTGR